MPVAVLPPAKADDAVAVLCEAFADYPVMRYVLGPAPNYLRRLRALIGFFIAARYIRQDLVLGAFDQGGELVAVALVTLPGDHPPPEALAVRREAVWRELGAEERARYEAYGAVSHQFDIPEPHHHLNMIGALPSRLGQGHARTLLDHLHREAEADHGSCGVTLSTEAERNLALYEHFGYRRLGHAKVAPDLETWALYRPRGV